MQDITLNTIEKIFLVIWIRDISTPATGTVQRSKVFLIFSLRVPLFVFCFTKYYLEFNSILRDSFSVEKLSSWRKKERGRCEWWILDPLDQLQEFSGCSNSIMSSVTRWLNYLFNIWPFPTMSSWTTAYLENWPKYVHNFAQYWIHHRKNYKILLIFFARVAKFHQIWSHLSCLNLKGWICLPVSLFLCGRLTNIRLNLIEKKAKKIFWIGHSSRAVGQHVRRIVEPVETKIIDIKKK